MNPRPVAVLSPRQLASILAAHPWRWLGPASVVIAMAAAYALLWPPIWEASQALVIRSEAAGQEIPGRFSQPDEMKIVQETLLELARSQGVLAGALAEVGPPANDGKDRAAWPAPEDVAELRDALKFVPPKGAEFGKTEIFYLQVRDRDRQRAVALVAAVCGRLEAAFQSLRDAKAKGAVAELEKAANLAAADLAQSSARLTAIEKQLGSDLAELRLLNEPNAGESVLRRSATEIRNELRQATTARNASEELLRLLGEVRTTPDRLLAMPQTLLESQPALRRLKEGLIDAQLSAAQLQGRLSDAHPLVVAARKSEKEISDRLNEELKTAIAGLEVNLRMDRDRIAMLEGLLAEATGRLEQLAAERTPYANLVAECRKRTELLERAQQRLADARASQATASAANLISRIDAPDAGPRPVGPSRAVVLLVGAAAGLLTGWGAMFLTLAPPPAGALAGSPLPAFPNGHGSASRTLPFRAALRRLAADGRPRRRNPH